ncbi:MAG: tRNA-guanine transglycosylase DpdA [Bacillota bacterium]
MNKQQGKKKETKTSGYLLILACSQTKKKDRTAAPAIYLYDGVNYRVLRKILLERGWPPGLEIKILSAQYGLIDATTIIRPYNLRLDSATAESINQKTLDQLRDLGEIYNPLSIFVNLGIDYLPAVKGLDEVFPDSKIIYAQGPIGLKMKAMKQWLDGLRYCTSTLKGCSKKKRSYLYFFPDWDDYIYEPFSSDDEKVTKGVRTYAHEVSGSQIPFDGILLSLSHIHVRKGALYRLINDHDGRVQLRRRLRIPRDILLFGDCGAFSYVGESEPPFTPKQAAELYHKFSFDVGASVDHIPLPEVPVRQDDGSVRKQALSESERYTRMYLTRDNAAEFLQIWKRNNYSFTPLGVIQGIGTQSYVECLHDYLDMGYQHIALGGLVPRTDDEILDILCAVRRSLQVRTRGCRENVWIHLFGILRPKLQPIFKELGVSSFDSASYFRKAWLRSDQNYLAPDGKRWYGTIRVPISTSKPMRLAADSNGLSHEELAEMERQCLNAIDACNTDPSATRDVISAIDRYGPLLERKGEDNHFADKHALLLKDRPWESCQCPFCRSAGIHVVVFRGANRNKRRGLHNTWVFYHCVLHGKSIPNLRRPNK